MSLENRSAVMRAGNNEAALKALAISGNMDAIAALKKLLDNKNAQAAAARQAGLQQPDTPPVLEQIVGQLGQQEYAHGGRVRSFAGGGVPAFELYTDNMPRNMKPAYAPSAAPLRREPDPEAAPRGPGFLDRAGSDAPEWLAKLVGWYTQESEPDVAPTYDDRARLQSRYPPKGKVSTVPAKPAPAAPRVQSGIAPDMSSGPPNKATAADIAEGRKLSAEGPAAAPDVKDLTDAELTARLAELTPLQKEREALRTKSREQLEAAYNAKVKNLTPSKYDRFMDFMAGVAAKGGSSAAQALGAGALNMHAKDKGRKTEMANVKEMYDKADLLEQQAALADKFGDVEKANALRKEAAQLQKQLAAQKSTEALQKSQAGYYDAQAEFTRNDKARIAEITAEAQRTRANRPTGSGLRAAAGNKPPTPAQIEQRTQSLTKQYLNADPTLGVDEARGKAEAKVRESMTGTPSAAPTKQRIRLDAQGNIIQ